MRHRLTRRKLGRPTDQRKALMRGLVKDLLSHETIRTTEAKAKEARRDAEAMITLGKRGNLHARRQALSFLNDKTVVSQVFDTLAPQADRRAAARRLRRPHRRRSACARPGGRLHNGLLADHRRLRARAERLAAAADRRPARAGGGRIVRPA